MQQTQQTETTMGGDNQRTVYLELLGKHYHSIRHTILALVANAHDAEDVLQNACMSMWRSFDSYDQSRSFRGWACTIAANEARAFLKKGSQRTAIRFSPEALANLRKVEVGANELFEMREEKLSECIAELRVGDQQLIWQCYGNDVKTVELAKRKSCPTSTIYNRLARLRKKLHECINRKLRLT
ncbi:RNA polymerase sigma factor [Calycomorphotria hydatis]|uniref:RNA polymerase sigma factor n=1 Tax=Calycomorphotria hydatis TaxID=2528027 RepID=A0A517TAM1_9PLAN|nr:sigma-70 family RNA polymerase sigma factor [Calycomorphotria hydatis]QDT65413.1 RNA polymerase sigma factor [Calycomorphotria hydatis]